MISKVFTIRDADTLGGKALKVIATRVAATSPAEAQVLDGTPGAVVPGVILLGTLDAAGAPSYSPFDHETGGPAMRIVHQYIEKNWFDLGSGAELDIASILAPAGQAGTARRGRS